MSAPLIGILGGIGSGKSSVIRQVTDFDLTIIDADVVGHDVLKLPEVRQQLVDAFGTGILNGNDVDRKQLGRVVFGDHDHQEANLERLNSIVHPEIRRQLHQQIDSAKQHSDAVVLDASLLLEGNWDEHCDSLIFVDTPLQIRQQRVQQNRGWDATELPRREKNQIAVDEKRRRTDHVVDNSGTLGDSVRQMAGIVGLILREFRSQK